MLIAPGWLSEGLGAIDFDNVSACHLRVSKCRALDYNFLSTCTWKGPRIKKLDPSTWGCKSCPGAAKKSIAQEATMGRDRSHPPTQ